MILRKIIKIAATRCHILKLKCTKFDFYSAPPDRLVGFKGPTSKEGRGREGRGGQGRAGEGGRKGEGKEKGYGEGEGGEGEWASLTHYFRLKSCTDVYMTCTRALPCVVRRCRLTQNRTSRVSQ